ncbi:hypothetical protein, partial [Dietzia sp. UCD-THP]|uniref:hypothetical protein n=1 Tax=Dietzia sp. UCD-THP TaxID=1292020 RepID=UPI001EE68CCC
ERRPKHVYRIDLVQSLAKVHADSFPRICATARLRDCATATDTDASPEVRVRNGPETARTPSGG